MMKPAMPAVAHNGLSPSQQGRHRTDIWVPGDFRRRRTRPWAGAGSTPAVSAPTRGQPRRSDNVPVAPRAARRPRGRCAHCHGDRDRRLRRLTHPHHGGRARLGPASATSSQPPQADRLNARRRESPTGHAPNRRSTRSAHRRWAERSPSRRLLLLHTPTARRGRRPDPDAAGSRRAPPRPRCLGAPAASAGSTSPLSHRTTATT